MSMSFRRRAFLLGACALVAARTGVANAAALPLVVVLSITKPEDQMLAFDKGLRDHGLIEGSTVVISHLTAAGQATALPMLAAEAVSLSPKVIVAVGATAARAAQKATHDIPIVVVTGDMVSAGLVKNMGRPEGNTTGFSFFNTGLPTKRLSLLLEANPSLRRLKILMFSHPTPTQAPALSMVDKFLSEKRIDSEIVRVATVADLKVVVASVPSSLEDGVFVWPSPVFDGRAREIGGALAKHRIVAAVPWKSYVEGGGLISYSPDILAIWRGVAMYVDRILRGAKPSELAVAQPTSFELVVNLRSAQALGLTIPVSILAQANDVIE